MVVEPHTVLHSDCTNLHSHQQSMKVSFSLHTAQHLLFLDFFMMEEKTVSSARGVGKVEE